MIVKSVAQVREIYAEAAERGWVLPCFCTENLVTTESILTAARDWGAAHGMKNVPVTVAMTINYPHRPQALNFTNTGDWATGLRLFMSELEALTRPGAPFADLRVLAHLDHVQVDEDRSLWTAGLSEFSLGDFSSIMFDASTLPFEENIRLTADFTAKNRDKIYIEGACDEIMDATGSQHNDVTTAESADRYMSGTGVDMIVANLGTEHRASGKELMYHGDAARAIKAKVGSKLVLHGCSSVPNSQVKGLFADGVCKVNIWTALERDSAPALFAHSVRHASLTAGPKAVDALVAEGYLTPKCQTGEKPNLANFTTVSRGRIVFAEMTRFVRDYLDMWYV